MAVCNGCGGIVGRDCYNPQECEWIAQDNQRRHDECAISALQSSLTTLEAAAEKMAGTIGIMVEACNNGGIDSQEIGEPENGIPLHKWHEEWVYYASGDLAEYRKIKDGV